MARGARRSLGSAGGEYNTNVVDVLGVADCEIWMGSVMIMLGGIYG